MRRANGHEGERRHTEHQYNGRADQQLPAQQCLGSAQQQEQTERRYGEKSRRVIGVAEPAQVRDQQQEAVGAPRLRRRVMPAEGGPTGGGEPEHREGVHLLVDDTLVPDRERGRPDPCTGDRDDQTRCTGQLPAGQRPMRDQKPERGGNRARGSGQKVDARGESQREGNRCERVRYQHEHRIARGMRDAKRLRRGDVLAGVPHCGARRQREHIQHKNHGADDCCRQIRRGFVGKCLILLVDGVIGTRCRRVRDECHGYEDDVAKDQEDGRERDATEPEIDISGGQGQQRSDSTSRGSAAGDAREQRHEIGLGRQDHDCPR